MDAPEPMTKIPAKRSLVYVCISDRWIVGVVRCPGTITEDVALAADRSNMIKNGVPAEVAHPPAPAIELDTVHPTVPKAP